MVEDDASTREIKLLQELRHKSELIIEYVDDFAYSGIKRCIITEYYANGDLDGIIEQYKANNKHIPLNKITYWNWEILQALVFLHHLKIIHRDIKPK
jgi:NIMA (never in mitosis gene a)-related kinase